MIIVLNNNEYKLVDNHRDCFDLNEIQEKLNDTDYFDGFDYIFGDYSYDKLRLKGFYEKTNKSVSDINNYDKINEYIKNYCSYGCKYFILKKNTKSVVSNEIDKTQKKDVKNDSNKHSKKMKNNRIGDEVNGK